VGSPSRKINQRIALLFVIEAALLWVIWKGTTRQIHAIDRSVNDIAELKDPSPYRAALLGHLGKIRLGLQGFLGSGDPALFDQMMQSRKDFESALPEFEKENPRLFPKTAVEEIRRQFDAFKQSIDHTLDANTKRTNNRAAMDQNFARIIVLIDHNIKPLIRDEQAESEDRREAALNIENQARAWQQNLARAWTQPSPSATELTFENDSRGSTFIDRYASLELLSKEKKSLKEVRALWQKNSDLGHDSFALEKVVSEAQGFMDAQRDLVVAALNRFLPAMPPAELQDRRHGYVIAMRIRFGMMFGMGLLALISLSAVSLASYRLKRGIRLWPEPKPKAKAPVAAPEPTLKMDLKGLIVQWSHAAERLYGYAEDEMTGQSISKLFESEEEIARLYKELLAAPQTTFETTHRGKEGTLFRVKIQFMPVSDDSGKTAAIGLICTHR
jgi:PAS domain S-box-containing protein